MSLTPLGVGARLIGVGRIGTSATCAVLQSPTHSQRASYSSDLRFLDRVDSAALKRGRGGRSSFSGLVVTVFGSSGVTGPYVVSKLGKTGSQIVLPYRCDQTYVIMHKVSTDLGQAVFYPFDKIVGNEEAVKTAMKYSNVVVNLVGNQYETKRSNFTQSNVETAQVIAKCARELGISKLVHISALNCDKEHEGYYTPGGSGFLKSKAESEKVVREEFPNAIIFRPSDIWGNRDRFFNYYADLTRRRGFKYMGLPFAGKGVWKQPVAANDFAQAIVNVLTTPDANGLTYEIVGPRRYELREMVDFFHRVLRRDHEWGHQVYDLKYDPFMKYQAKLIEKLFVYRRGKTPMGHISMDKLERDAISDQVDGLPNLLDLGIKPTILEDVTEFELRVLKCKRYYRYAVDELAKPVPPKFVAAL